MRTIRIMGSKAQFRGGDQFHFSLAKTVVGQRNTANLDIVFRRHRDFHVGFHAPPATPELGAICREDCRVSRVFHVQRLMRCRPGGIAFFLAEIKKRPPIIAGRIRAPARDIKIAPAAVARAGIGDHQRIAAVPEKMTQRNRSVLIEHPVRRCRRLRYRPHRHLIGWTMNKHRMLRRYSLK